jgi:bifunctional non-homologous end joining protein LigD
MTKKKFGPYTVESSRQDKVFFPDADITKGDVIAYYEKIAEFMLPHLKDRPLILRRFPDGIEAEGFFQ